MVKADMVLDLDRPSGGGWLRFGYATTFIYVAAVLSLIVLSEAENSFARFRALQLNTLGDFLAGLFAPLAFLWLFIAVRVQAEELSLQRQELRLTRREFEENRKVAQAQVAEAQKQAEFVGEQTLILKRTSAQQVIERSVQQLVGTARVFRNLGSEFVEGRLGADFDDRDPAACLIFMIFRISELGAEVESDGYFVGKEIGEGSIGYLKELQRCFIGLSLELEQLRALGVEDQLRSHVSVALKYLPPIVKRLQENAKDEPPNI